MTEQRQALYLSAYIVVVQLLFVASSYFLFNVRSIGQNLLTACFIGAILIYLRWWARAINAYDIAATALTLLLWYWLAGSDASYRKRLAGVLVALVLNRIAVIDESLGISNGDEKKARTYVAILGRPQMILALAAALALVYEV